MLGHLEIDVVLCELYLISNRIKIVIENVLVIVILSLAKIR